jgi:hypothetical protein
MFRNYASITAALFATASCNELSEPEPIDPQQCSDVFIHHVTPAPTDFGNGVIEVRQSHAGYHNPSDYWGAERVMLASCETGQSVRLTETARNNYGEKIIDHTETVAGLLDQARQMAAADLIEFLSQEATTREIESDTFAFGPEICGCRAFYPELRGEKTPYEVTQ